MIERCLVCSDAVSLCSREPLSWHLVLMRVYYVPSRSRRTGTLWSGNRPIIQDRCLPTTRGNTIHLVVPKVEDMVVS